MLSSQSTFWDKLICQPVTEQTACFTEPWRIFALFPCSHGSTVRQLFLSSLVLLVQGSSRQLKMSCCPQEVSTTKWPLSQEEGQDWAGPWPPPCLSWGHSVSSPAGRRIHFIRIGGQLFIHQSNQKINLVCRLCGRSIFSCLLLRRKCDV